MSDFVGLRETFLKAYTESHNDTSDDDVLKELPSIFQDTRAKFFDEDDYECNRAVLVRLKLEGKLEHKFNTSTAFAYITSTRDALRPKVVVSETAMPMSSGDSRECSIFVGAHARTRATR